MTIDLVSIGQHLLVLAAVWGFFTILGVWGRFILGWVAAALFCVGEYGWAVLAFFLWAACVSAHREEMFRLRAMRLYNGPWVD